MVDIRQTKNLYITLSGDAATDLVCVGGRVRERLSTISELRFEFFSKLTTFDPVSILGKKITLQTENGFKFSGIVISVEDLGLERGVDVFAAEVRPWLWLAGIGEENRVFQNMTTVAIIKSVLQDMGFDEIGSTVTGAGAPREYCVQYGESNLAFISRLMEEDGIFYYFDHSGDTEKFEMCDDSSVLGDHGDVPFTVANLSGSTYTPVDSIFEWTKVSRVVSGKATLWDYDFTNAKAGGLVVTSSIPSGRHAYRNVERYQSGGHYDTADDEKNPHAKYIAQAHAADAYRSTGLATSTDVRSGSHFHLKYKDRPAVEGKYLTVASTHYFRFDDGPARAELERHSRNVELIEYPESMRFYEAEFEVLASEETYRPQKVTPWPEVPSLLTAIVTGPKDAEIHTDEYGRIRIQFPWDRKGKNDEHSSCWVRTVMPWTGSGYGFVAVPRVGMEVIVQFERGNIDRPICTGMVYNSVNMPHYKLPGDMNKLTLRTNSTKGTGKADAKGYHELTMDDTFESEKILFQSQRDYEQIVKQNATIRIGMDMKDPEKGDLTQTIKNSKTENIEEADWTLNVKKGNRVANVKKDDTTTVEGKSTTTITGNTAMTVKTGNLTETIDTGHMATTVKTGNQTVDVKMGNQTTNVDMGNVSIKAALGKVTIEAMQSIELKVGGSSIKIDMTGVTIKGAMMAKMEGGLQAEVKGGVMTDVKGSAMVQIQGGITMIN